MALTTFTNGTVAEAPEVNANFQFESFRTPVVTHGFNIPIVNNTLQNIAQYSAGSTVFKFVIQSPSGSNITKLSVTSGGQQRFTTKPTFKLQYSSDNSIWADMTNLFVQQGTSDQETWIASGSETGLNVTTAYIRFIGESQTFMAFVTNLQIQYTTDTNESHTVQCFHSSPMIRSANGVINASQAVYDSGSGGNFFVCPILAPEGKNIKKVAALGYVTFANGSTTTTSSDIEYSTDGSTWLAMDEGNTVSASLAAGNQRTDQVYGLKESLNNSIVYVSLECFGLSSNQLLQGHLFVLATWE